MLRLLRIKNFAIIDELELEFETGFNAITGETGAGKSIILDAIGLILGNRANTDVIRSGSDEAFVEALFDIEDNTVIQEKLELHGFTLSEMNNEIVIKRTVHRNGKNKIYLSGQLVTLSQLADICSNLVDLCSQHEHQSLSKTQFQLSLLDRYGGLLPIREQTTKHAGEVQAADLELQELTSFGEKAREEDFLRFQIQELAEFQPLPNEEETLSNERKRLLNSSQLGDSASQTLAILETDEDGVQTLLGKAIARLRKGASIDTSLNEAVEHLERASSEVAEGISALTGYVENLEVDPNRLEEVEARLSKWSEMKRKYGSTLEEILALQEKIEKELNMLTQRDERIAAIQKQIIKLKSAYAEVALILSKKRKNTAKTLEKTIQSELAELMMPSTQFKIDFAEQDEGTFSKDGIDRVQYLFSPNPGESLKPISRIASGGELSRVMLAIRRTISDRGGIGVYLFDEIDSGIGGQTASVVGKKLKSVSKYNQVICITHLPQVAAFADVHFSVSKKVTSGRTMSSIVSLEGNKRVDEIARMLGGLDLNEKSRAHARDLLKQATL